MLTIKTFGHYWSRDLVDWGWRGKGNQGSLKGTRRPGAKEFDADFRDQIGIYLLFNSNREVIYLGQTGKAQTRLFNRLRQHANGPLRDRWTNFSWFGFLEAETKTRKLVEAEDPDSAVSGSHVAALDEIEAILLQVLEPRLNKQGPKWGDGTQEYFQYVEPEDEVTLELIREELQELRATLAGRNKS
jgi:excinuclease UvrABC nuclease subunit